MSMLKEGDKAPTFSAHIESGATVSLADYASKKLILFFYPKDDTPSCTAENCNLRDNYTLLQEKGYEILGVSPDTAKKHTKFKEKYQLPFPLIPDTEQELLKAYGVWGEKQMYGRTYEGVLRTTFVINEAGVIEKIFSKVETKSHAEQILGSVGA